MQYAEYALTDLGYADEDGNPLPSVEGRDNQTQPFHHLGFTGYPKNAAMIYERPDKSRCLALYPNGATMPKGGTATLETDVLALLLESYGRQEGTTMVDGLPVAPKRDA